MRPVNKREFHACQAEYHPYGTAKNDLISALGGYCSYCERQSYSCGIDVEHIKHKRRYANRATLWSNFLLACKNCNSVKGTQPVKGMFFPTISDTFRIFAYHRDGRVDVNQAFLTQPADRQKAQALIRLVGLDRRPGHPDYSAKDKRWSDRKQTWALAQRYLAHYQTGNIDTQVIIDLAKLSGGWSIWMTVFKYLPPVLTRLINEFPATRASYFIHYLRPKPRPAR